MKPLSLIPILAELTIHVDVCLKNKGTQACDARRPTGRGHAKMAVLLDNATSPICHMRVFLSIMISIVVPDAILRHVGQAMHEANDLVPPPMHQWPFRQFSEIKFRSISIDQLIGGVTFLLR